jgi:hypothetical protein
MMLRDLFHGAGGPEFVPRDATFEFVARDTSGWSPGFDVRDRDGVEWSVKLGPEAQSEVVSSRVLWAIGFHQPPTYYLERWTVTGQESGPQAAGRFRPTLAQQEVIGDWSWYENPFVGSREFGGLIVANLVLNSWDWKTRPRRVPWQNDVSRVAEVVPPPRLRPGHAQRPAGLRIPGLHQAARRFVADRVHYRGIYRDVIDTVTPDQVRWTCELLSRLSEQQWRDAFRAGGYDSDQTARYVAKIKAKIAQGLELTRG